MPIFSQQQAIPVTYFNGYVTESDTVVPLLEAYDHLLTCISATQYAGDSDDYLEIDDQDGNYLWSALLPAAGESGPTVYWSGFIVLQDVTEIQIVDSTLNAQLSISGFRLAPSATSIFSS
jgi:hypothetical protein